MTAEIALMNKSAIALAADSAVTIQTSTGQKIYNTVNKLFMLSKYHPMGIMVYGSADLIGVPWETAIKHYRKRLATRRFDTVEQYGDDFLSFLESETGLFTEEDQATHAEQSVTGFFQHLKELIDAKVKESLMSAQLTIEQVQKISANIIEEQVAKLEKAPVLPRAPATHCEDVQKVYAKQIDAAIPRVFEKLPLSDDSKTRLRKIAGLLFCRDCFSQNRSGVVVAGFGEKEFFPALTWHDIECIANGKLKCKPIHGTTRINRSNSASIIPFAQTEMVKTFVEGINPSYERTISGFLDKMFQEMPALIANSIAVMNEAQKQDLVGKLHEVGKNILKEYKEKTSRHKTQRHVKPIIDTVAVLPKEELAAMAESLVNLTSFKRKVSLEAETVGGPIDVAVISKGDGFIWVKRKHYFKPELNPYFFSNYYRTHSESDNK